MLHGRDHLPPFSRYPNHNAERREDFEQRVGLGHRDILCLRQTGISLRLELGPNPDYRDIAKWARTSPAMIAAFYDQTHPQLSVERIVGFRKRTSGKENQSALSESAGE